MRTSTFPTRPRSFDLELHRFRRIFPPKPHQLFIPGNHDIGHHSKCLHHSSARLTARSPSRVSESTLAATTPDAALVRYERAFGPSSYWRKASEHHVILSIDPSALGAADCHHGQQEFWHSIERLSDELTHACPAVSCSRTLLLHYPLGRPLYVRLCPPVPIMTRLADTPSAPPVTSSPRAAPTPVSMIISRFPVEFPRCTAGYPWFLGADAQRILQQV